MCFTPLAVNGSVLLFLGKNSVDVRAGDDLETAVGLGSGIDGEHCGGVGNLAKLNKSRGILMGGETYFVL